VASQTLINLQCIQEASQLPVLSPLVGMNKDETILLAKQIGTYEHSIEPYPDCCSFMIAAHPETRGVLDLVKQFEVNIDGLEELLLEAVESVERLEFS